MGTSVSSGTSQGINGCAGKKGDRRDGCHLLGEVMSFHSAESWLSNWLADKAGSASVRTMERYRQVIRDFLAHLGPRAKASIASISPGDLINFRDELREEGRSAYTCNTVVKRVLNIPFEAARKLGFITVNPVATVESLRDGGVK
jgi:site-specific recombinase XerD